MSENADIPEGEYVVSFDETSATDRAFVGGKGANLARLSRAGLPVPDGFCVTTAAYKELIDDPTVHRLIRELPGLDPTDTTAVVDAGSALRARIQERDMPEEIREAIEDSLDAMASGSGEAYAVRSSATAEDLPEASFAGQQETFLNVHRDAIVDRICDCMASVFTDRAIAYRATNDILHGDVALAVVVQRMITPDSSGILFTADPRTGNRNVASIEAGVGLGEALVSGEVTADSVRADKRTGDILEYVIGDQQVAVRPLPEGGTETVEIDDCDDQVLTDEQVRALVEMGREIEELFDSPQDIEWCLKDGRFSIVQARPITSLFPVPSPEPEDDRLHVYFSNGHVQAMPEAMPPLVTDIWMAAFEETFTEFGFETETQWAAEAGGRVYVDLTAPLRINVLRDRLPGLFASTSEPISVALKDVIERRGDEFHTERSLRETISGVSTLGTVVWAGTKKSLPLVSSMFGGSLDAFIGEPSPRQEREKWERWGRLTAKSIRDREGSAERVQAVFDSTKMMISTESGSTEKLPSVGPLFVAFGLEGLLQWWFSDAPDDVNAIERGFPDELVTQINIGLGDLADVARSNPTVANALREEASLEEIEAVDGGKHFVTAFTEYLNEFGHRATGELDISRPRWREDPSGLLRAVRANLEHEEAGKHRARIEQMERDATEAAKRLEQRAGRGVFGSIRKRIVRRLIRTYRGYIQTREYPKQGMAHVFTAWRDALRDAGEELVDEGQLSDIEDVWYLRKDELFAALDGESIDPDIEARRAEFKRYTVVNAPPVLTSEGEAPSARIEREDVPDGALIGTGVSSGVVEGVARVVHDPREETIEDGEILIARSSDPGWTPLFLNAAGMVVEVGGQMSHGALVAREYGLPAVVSVPEATTRIKTGQRVRIDGTRGIVEIIDDDG